MKSILEVRGGALSLCCAVAVALGGCSREPAATAAAVAATAGAPAPMVLRDPSQNNAPLAQLVPAAGGFSKPVGVRQPPDGSAGLFVVEQGGLIRIVPPGAVTARAEAFLSLAEHAPPHGFTAAASEQGLLGLAFHPKYAQNGQFFINYTDAQGDTVVARYRADAKDPLRADAGSAEVVLRVDQPYSNHNGGDLAFGPDGFLYIAMGDGGAGGDPCRFAQTLDPAKLPKDDSAGRCTAGTDFTGAGANAASRALLGKLLRIDVDARTPAGSKHLCAANGDGAANYGIPAGNPFAGEDELRACDETWALGLRNPWRISFDRENGDLFIGDVGQNRIEEIDLRTAKDGGGANFGWPLCEGHERLGTPKPTECPLPDSALTPRPIASYPHAEGDCSVTGGYRYRGPVAALRGHYVLGDYCTGNIGLLRLDAGKTRWSAVLWEKTQTNISSFGEDAAGNLYLVDYAGGKAGKGAVLRFAEVAATP